eukprot:5141712-Alexandrium_andersonii.AAC.1
MNPMRPMLGARSKCLRMRGAHSHCGTPRNLECHVREQDVAPAHLVTVQYIPSSHNVCFEARIQSCLFVRLRPGASDHRGVVAARAVEQLPSHRRQLGEASGRVVARHLSWQISIVQGI